MKRVQLIILNIVLFLYQFEFIPFEGTDVKLSFYRIGIFPLLILFLIIRRNKFYKYEIPMYIFVFLFFSFNIISLIGYGYYSSLVTVLGNVIQFYVAYFYFRENRVEKSTLYVLSTWGLFQLPYFFTSLINGNLGLANRFLGFHWDPNYLCMSLLISFWAKIYLIRKDLSKSMKVVILSLSFVDILMILFSLSRGGLLALILTGLIYLFLYHRKLFYVLSIGSIFLLSFMMERSRWITWSDSLSLMDSIIYRTFVISETGDISAGRIDFINIYINMLSNGDGVFFGIPLNYYIENINSGGYPHNAIIEILLQGGAIVGGIFYSIILYNISKIIFYSFKYRNLPYELLFLLSGLSVLLFLSFTLKISWLFVGLVFAISNKIIFRRNYILTHKYNCR
jgi:hypothetical protein